ncbi:hypothetical protein OC25_02000 [Pedobacter kyungheensis]|uniref:Uncharacterized protein n=1 Tax=Pedobacter kyungheensis TaxID=1069985 RepID=A0A0C1FUE8_9SPHI|nr:hypothetical protein [Pedobacter kyungheensis]KIA96542.1 hypothetical protein OC25_02000 [Pedobacter kyungheensis]
MGFIVRFELKLVNRILIKLLGAWSTGRKIFDCRGAAAGPTQVSEYRFYFKDGKSIRETENKKVVNLKEKAAEVIALAKKALTVKAKRNFADLYCDKTQ